MENTNQYFKNFKIKELSLTLVVILGLGVFTIVYSIFFKKEGVLNDRLSLSNQESSQVNKFLSEDSEITSYDYTPKLGKRVRVGGHNYPTFHIGPMQWLAKDLILPFPQEGMSYYQEENRRGKMIQKKRMGVYYTQKAASTACQMLGEGWMLPTDEHWSEMLSILAPKRPNDTENYGYSRIGGFGALTNKTKGVSFNAKLRGWGVLSTMFEENEVLFLEYGLTGYYWTSDVAENGTPLYFALDGSKGTLTRAYSDDKGSIDYYSCRCVKDNRPYEQRPKPYTLEDARREHPLNFLPKIVSTKSIIPFTENEKLAEGKKVIETVKQYIGALNNNNFDKAFSFIRNNIGYPYWQNISTFKSKDSYGSEHNIKFLEAPVVDFDNLNVASVTIKYSYYDGGAFVDGYGKYSNTYFENLGNEDWQLIFDRDCNGADKFIFQSFTLVQDSSKWKIIDDLDISLQCDPDYTPDTSDTKIKYEHRYKGLITDALTQSFQKWARINNTTYEFIYEPNPYDLEKRYVKINAEDRAREEWDSQIYEDGFEEVIRFNVLVSYHSMNGQPALPPIKNFYQSCTNSIGEPSGLIFTEELVLQSQYNSDELELIEKKSSYYKCPVPHVVNLTLGKAKEVLEANHFIVDSLIANVDHVDKNTVVWKQFPEVGYEWTKPRQKFKLYLTNK